MKNVLLNRKVGFGLVFLLVLSGYLATATLAASEERYTKYNIHTQAKGNRLNASYANYTNPGVGHYILPAGSQITILKKSRKQIVFRINGDGREVYFQFHERNMGMGIDEYIEKITSAKPVSLQKLSALDRQGVKEGKALQGMTKEGVKTALGYPASHRTPSLDSPTWIYWTNRFGTLGVDFDERGKVIAVRN